MSRNENVWTDAKCAALRVEFLTSREELFLYAKAIYSAMICMGHRTKRILRIERKEYQTY